MEPDGVLGPKTLFQLNISAEVRVRQIVANMERWRWMPEDLGDHYVIVNIAGFELKRVRANTVEERMRVVVGKPYHKTPIFSDKMEYLEINPYWNVPTSIATREELPKLQSDPSALAEKGFEVVRGDEVVDVRAINWSRYSRTNFPFRLRQRPGPSNALGRVKFMFPNRFNVYLHDTPAQSLFARAERAFSHGCIRVARPIDLAEQILAQKPDWSRRRIEKVLASGKRTVVPLSEPLNVHITYATAWRQSNDTVHFAPDIYRRDEALRRALFGKRTPS
jgi:murein L,D-transpeptidase YcbB/YkuD